LREFFNGKCYSRILTVFSLSLNVQPVTASAELPYGNFQDQNEDMNSVSPPNDRICVRAEEIAIAGLMYILHIYAQLHSSPPASAEVKKIWIYTSTPPYAFMA
jgi:hypothetical protein